MTFFAKVTAPSRATFETVELRRLAWNSGLKVGLQEYYKTHAGPMTGKKHSAETRAKIGASHKGKVTSEETRAKMSAASKGKPKKTKWSAESRAKLSASKTKPVMTPHGMFPSIRAIAEASGRYDSTVRTWMRKFPEHYYYVNKGE